MSRRPARATQEEIERALRAAEAQRTRSGGLYRVRVEKDGAIVLEPATDAPPSQDPSPAGANEWIVI
jgi:hypothetical protein